MSEIKQVFRLWMLASVKKAGAVQISTGLLTMGALFSDVGWHWWFLALFGYFMYVDVGHLMGYQYGLEVSGDNWLTFLHLRK